VLVADLRLQPEFAANIRHCLPNGSAVRTAQIEETEMGLMKKKALAKLKSNNGVSILVAILYLLAASMVISVILAAANTATKNFNSEHKQQQAYLTVSSAAMYMRDELGSYTYTITEQQGSKTPAYDVKNTEDTASDACHFAPLMKAALDAFDGQDPPTSYVKDFSLTLNSSAADRQNKKVFEPVSVHFVMESDRDINVTLTIYETDDNKKDNIYYQMTIYLPSDSWTTTDVVGENPEGEDIIATTTEWTWTKGNIVRGTA